MTSLDQRLKIEKQYCAWAKEKRVPVLPSTFIAYMEIKGYLDVDKMLEDIKDIKSEDVLQEDKKE